MPQQTLTADTLNGFTQQHPVCVVYFSGPGCAVCEQLKPKLTEVLQREYPRLGIGLVDASLERSLAADQGVFTIPTLVLLIEGRETRRYTRSFSPSQVADDLQRPYELCFGS